jgi:hypothetical protein
MMPIDRYPYHILNITSFEEAATQMAPPSSPRIHFITEKRRDGGAVEDLQGLLGRAPEHDGRPEQAHQRWRTHCGTTTYRTIDVRDIGKARQYNILILIIPQNGEGEHPV